MHSGTSPPSLLSPSASSLTWTNAQLVGPQEEAHGRQGRRDPAQASLLLQLPDRLGPEEQPEREHVRLGNLQVYVVSTTSLFWQMAQGGEVQVYHHLHLI